MSRLWQRMNYLTRHQVYLRVLPVLFVSVMVLGYCSWMLFEQRTLAAASEHQKQELIQLATRLQFQVGRLAMSAELRKSELTATAPIKTQSHQSTALKIGEGIIGLKQVSATMQVDSFSATPPVLVMATESDTKTNRQILDRWYQARIEPWMRQNEGVQISGAPDLKSPVILESDPWHQIFLFQPVFLSRGSSSETHLPLLVRKTSATIQSQTLLLVNLGKMLSDAPTPDWLCLVDQTGRILWETDRSTTGIFQGMSGNGFLKIEKELAHGGFKQGLLGRWRNPWLVTTIPSPTLPLTLFSARPATGLRNLVLKYMAFVMALTTLSLLGAVLGVMGVMKRVTRRLSDLADSMSSLAKGEYSRRMPEDSWDEIGQLVGYFNLMAVSLDEAHREIKDKTLHLRAALENMKMLDKAKDDFLVLISHEVRTPLTAIMGGVDFIKTSAKSAEQKDKEVLQRLNILEVISIIQSSGERLSGFMTDAIQMTAIQSTDRQLDLKATAVVELVDAGLSGLREKANLRSIRVENQLDEQVWSILGDPGILKMAFAKILDNALKHNRDGGKILIREAWDVPGQGSPGELLKPENLRSLMDQPNYQGWEDEDIRWRLIEVFNSGDPIPKDRCKALFGKFELVGRIEHHHQGSGLSLPIAQGAVECHGGRILLHSHESDGNSFYLLLPTLLDPAVVNETMPTNLWDDIPQGVSGAAGNEKMGQVADLTALKIKVDDLGTSIDSGIHQTGSGINGASGSDHQKKVTVGSRRK